MPTWLAPLAGAGPWAAFLGLAGGLVWLMFTGRLVPASVLDREVDAEKRRADMAERALQISETRGDKQAEQLGEVLILLRAQDSVQRAVLQAPREPA